MEPQQPLPSQPAAPVTQAPGTSTMAILGLVFAFIVPLIGIILSIIGIKDTAPGKKSGRGLALAGLIISSLSTITSIIVFILMIAAWTQAKDLSQNLQSPESNTANQSSSSSGSINEDLELASPAWAFPATVDGWTLSVFNQNGINQLTKNGSEATFTSFQLLPDATLSGTTDKTRSDSFLDIYANAIKANTGLGLTTLKNHQIAFPGLVEPSIELSCRDFTYETAASGLMKARYCVRAMADGTLALQYAGPESAWTEAEWSLLTENIVISD